jgi:hypothetical protein
MNSRFLELRNKIKSLADTFVNDILQELDRPETGHSQVISPAYAISPKTSPPRKRRTRNELKTLIEAAVETFGENTTDKLIAEKCGISIAMIYREPYSTYLAEAKKEHKKKKNAEQAADYKKTEYKEELTAGLPYD